MGPQLQSPLHNGNVPIKNPREDEIELPPLVSSMVIAGLPPRQQSKFVVDAEERLMKIWEHWQINSFESYCRLGVSMASFMYSGAVSSDRLVAVSFMNAVTFLLDDLFFDSPNDLLLEEYGIDRSIRESPHKIGEFFNNLILQIFRQQEPLCDPTPIERMMWEMGQDFRRLSNPEWFNACTDALIGYCRVSVASSADIAGHRSYLQDLESYTQMRAWNSGGLFSVNLMELAYNAFLPDEVRAQPLIRQLTNATLLQMAFVNDIFSYHKEVMQEDNPRNLVKVLMESEGTLLPQAAWRAVDVVNSYTRLVLKLETQLAASVGAEPWAHAARRYVEGLKEYMSGSIHVHSMNKRYRHPDSVFPELRAITNVHHQLQEII